MLRIDPVKSSKVTVTFGGGMGGMSRLYLVESIVSEKGGRLEFMGWQSRAFEKPDNIALFVHGIRLYTMHLEHFPQERIDLLEKYIKDGDLAAAEMEYTRTARRSKGVVPSVQKVHVVAQGSWFMEQPYA